MTTSKVTENVPNKDYYEISQDFNDISTPRMTQEIKHQRDISRVSPSQLHFSPTKPLNIKRELSVKQSKEEVKERPISFTENKQQRLQVQEQGQDINDLLNSKTYQSQNSLNTFITVNTYETAMESQSQFDNTPEQGHIRNRSNVNANFESPTTPKKAIVDDLVTDINNLQMGQRPQAASGDLYNDDPTPVIKQNDTFEQQTPPSNNTRTTRATTHHYQVFNPQNHYSQAQYQYHDQQQQNSIIKTDTIQTSRKPLFQKKQSQVPRPMSYAATPGFDFIHDRASLSSPNQHFAQASHRQSSVYSTVPPVLDEMIQAEEQARQQQHQNHRQIITEFDSKQERRRIAKEMDVSFNSDYDNESSYTDESRHLQGVNGDGSPSSQKSGISHGSINVASDNRPSPVKDSFRVTAVRGKSVLMSSSSKDSLQNQQLRSQQLRQEIQQQQQLQQQEQSQQSQTSHMETSSGLNDKSIQPGDEELFALFLIAIHPFEASTLELPSDSSICLSFDKNDVVFVHTVDSSGWGEVTSIKTLQRGWIPINFFTELIINDPKLPLNKSRLPLRYLLISAAKFLINPIETDNDQYEEIVEGNLGSHDRISLGLINDIRDGVKYLLEKTDCLSRSTEIVRQRPIIRKIRKTLLADWYSLMIKADSYKKSKKIVHLETLQLMVLQVVKKSIGFLEIWGIENAELVKEQQLIVAAEDNEISSATPKSSKGSIFKSTNQYTVNLPKLSRPPMAKERLNEVHNMLFSYTGLLLGRLDMVEHNPTGCQLLENITHQMIVLLRELLFISKSCSAVLHDQRKRVPELKNDGSLDTLLSLVSELVSAVKNFVTKTIDEDYFVGTKSVKIDDSQVYYYSTEGDELIGVLSRMTRTIAVSVENCHKSLKVIGDFNLSAENDYTDFGEIRITPEMFIKRCSLGLIKNFKEQKIDLRSIKRTSVKRQSRYSMIRGGLNNENCLTSSGSNLLQEFLPESKSFIRSSVFEPFLNEDNSESQYKIRHNTKEEIIRDQEGNLIGASLRGLIFLLTDEMTLKEGLDDYFANSFFLTYKLYTTGADVIEELIARFNPENKRSEVDDDDDEQIGHYSSFQSKMKHRRRLIVRVFQLWLQSYWDYERDYNLLPTLINFFNEAVSELLPIESKKLIELASSIICLTPTKINESKLDTGDLKAGHARGNSIFENDYMQLVNRKLGSSRKSSIISTSSSMKSINSVLENDLDDDEYIFEAYGLAKINSSHSNRNSISLPLPGLHTHNTSLLTKGQSADLEKLVLIHRKALGPSIWCHQGSPDEYLKVELKKMLKTWFGNSNFPLSQQLQYNDDYNLSELNSYELAKQITLIESKIFIEIKSRELMNISKFQKKTFPDAPNVSYSLAFTNMLSEYILESLLKTGISMKQRVLRLQNWLNVALSCYHLKNYNSLASIIASLQSTNLCRIIELWETLPEKYQRLFNDLKKIINHDRNFKGYRTKISKVLELELNSNYQKSPIPIVPYINLSLQDLTFIDEGNKDFRNSNSFLRARIINCDKFLKISKVISNLEFLQVPYDAVPSFTKKSNMSPSKRASMFSFSSFISATTNTEVIAGIPVFQEYILLELFRVHQLGLDDESRFWELSKKIQS